MTRHPSLDRILDAVRGDAGPNGDLVARHLADCASCRQSAAWIQDVLAAAAAGPLPEPSDELLARAFAISATPPSPGRSGERAPRNWSLARLVQDTIARPAWAGVRGGAGGPRLLYEAGGAHLDLEIAPTPENPERCRLTGQLLREGGKGPADVLALLWSGPQLIGRAVSDDLGTFVIENLGPGDYQLEVWSRAPDQAIRVASVVIGPEGGLPGPQHS